MKKYFWAVLTVLLCMTGCQNNAAAGQADTEQAASGSSETTTTVTEEQTSKSAETTTATTVTEELSEDIAVSREYEFDLDKYLERDRYEKYSLRNELEFLNDEQYDAYIRAWIFLDNLEYFNIPYTGDIPSHFLDESGEIRASYYDKETNTINPYMYISTYQSFYEYLQSVFTQDAVDKIMSHSFFKTVGDELYLRYGEKGGAIYFNGGEYNLIEENDSEVIFEYVAHQKNDEKEWIETHPLKLVCTDNGWRSEFFENLHIENATSEYQQSLLYQENRDCNIRTSEDIAVSREYEFDLDKYPERDKRKYQLRNELEFLSDEQYETFIRAWIFIDSIAYPEISNISNTSDIPSHWLDKNGEIYSSYYDETSHKYSPYEYVSTYQSFYEYLQSVFTQDAVDEIMSDERFLNVDGELYFEWGEAGGTIYSTDGKYELVEQNDSEVIFEYNASHTHDGKNLPDTSRTIKLINAGDGWRAELFDHLTTYNKAEIEEMEKMEQQENR